MSLLHDSMIAHVGVDLPCPELRASVLVDWTATSRRGFKLRVVFALHPGLLRPIERASRIHGPCAVQCRTVDMADTSEWKRLPAEFDRHQAKAHSFTRPDHSALTQLATENLNSDRSSGLASTCQWATSRLGAPQSRLNTQWVPPRRTGCPYLIKGRSRAVWVVP